jgi:hypothetical protein
VPVFFHSFATAPEIQLRSANLRMENSPVQ